MANLPSAVGRGWFVPFRKRLLGPEVARQGLPVNGEAGGACGVKIVMNFADSAVAN